MQYHTNDNLKMSYQRKNQIWKISGVHFICISPNSQYVVVVTQTNKENCKLHLFKLIAEEVQFVQIFQVTTNQQYCIHGLFYKNNREFVLGWRGAIDFFKIQNDALIKTQSIPENRWLLQLFLIENDESLIVLDENFFSIWRTQTFEKFQTLVPRIEFSAACLSQSGKQVVVALENEKIFIFKKAKNKKWMMTKTIRLFNKKQVLTFVCFLQEDSILLKENLVSLNQWTNKIIRNLKIPKTQGKVIDFFNQKYQFGYFLEKQQLKIRKLESKNFQKVMQIIKFNEQIEKLK